jgi:uncharacterized protein DUF4349
MLSRRNVFVVVAVMALAGLLGAACGGGRASTTTAPQSGADSRADRAAGAPIPEATVPGGPQPILGQFQLTAVGPRIIKTASVTLEIKDGSFEQQAQEVTLIAARHGGFVASSRTSGEKRLSGTVLLRIPASQFEVALGELKALGKVKGEQIVGEDVSAQFVDLEARLRNWEAQEAVLLRLMTRSTSIADSLKVQQALQDVQLAIEEIKGQLRVLGDQTDLSTITLTMAEKAPLAAAKKPNPFVRAWRSAIDETVAVLTAIVLGLGYLIPLFLMALAVGLGWLVYRRARAKAVPSA